MTPGRSRRPPTKPTAKIGGVESALPQVGVVRIGGLDADGEPLAEPAEWAGPSPPPRVVPSWQRSGHSAPAPGERYVARFSRIADGLYEASLLRRIDQPEIRVLGVFRLGPDGGRVIPTDRRQDIEPAVAEADSAGAEPGDLVLAELHPAGRIGRPRARIVERFGRAEAPRAAGLIAIHTHGLPTRFPSAALREAEDATVPPLLDRADLRALPLVTIDGDDARDFDDAVWAGPDEDPGNPGGWRLVVAIADVAFYVRPGSALDRAAYERGTSCYLPDRVEPMLPEALSAGLCSLQPDVDRACLAMEMWIDAAGHLRRHRVRRGLMRSAARLTYGQVQAAMDGNPDSATAPLLAGVLRPLYAAHAALAAARLRRGSIDLDLPERRVRLDPEGRVAEIGVRERLQSHRLIEDFMVCANVAAAESLESRGGSGLYRVHDQPAPDRLDALRPVLASFGHVLAKGQVVRPELFARILRAATGRPEMPLLADAILRAQAQAAYSASNIGHFGLALRRYMHFTSPIRRYADLVVHRALIAAHGLGVGGQDDASAGRLAAVAEHISMTERRAAAVERDAVDRYAAAWAAQRRDVPLPARIVGLSRFGLTLRLDGSGVDGFVPASTLPDDRYAVAENGLALVGQRWGGRFLLGERLRISVALADPLTGTLHLRLVDDAAQPPGLPGACGE